MRGEGGRVRAPLLHEWGPVRGPRRLPRPRSRRRPGRPLHLRLPARILVGTPGLAGAGGEIVCFYFGSELQGVPSYKPPPNPPVRRMIRLHLRSLMVG